jgi:hypothetical protein
MRLLPLLLLPPLLCLLVATATLHTPPLTANPLTAPLPAPATPSGSNVTPLLTLLPLLLLLSDVVLWTRLQGSGSSTGPNTALLTLLRL